MAIAKPAPTYLDELGKKYWVKLRSKLNLDGTNYDTLALLCSALSLYWRAEKDIQTTDIKNEFSGRKNPSFDIQKQAFQQIKDCLKILNKDSGNDPIEVETIV